MYIIKKDLVTDILLVVTRKIPRPRLAIRLASLITLRLSNPSRKLHACYRPTKNCLRSLFVGGKGFEPLTSSTSMKRSTN